MFHLRYDHQTEKKPRFGEIHAVFAKGKSPRAGDSVFAKQRRVPASTLWWLPGGSHRLLSKSSFVLIAVLLSLGQFGMYALIIFHRGSDIVSLSITGSNQAYRAISTSQLNVLPRLHLWPIDEVVYLGPQGYLVLRGASRLDAFSGYPVRT